MNERRRRVGAPFLARTRPTRREVRVTSTSRHHVTHRHRHPSTETLIQTKPERITSHASSGSDDGRRHSTTGGDRDDATWTRGKMSTRARGTFETSHADGVHDCAYDYYGRRVATASSDRTIRIFDVDVREGDGEEEVGQRRFRDPRSERGGVSKKKRRRRTRSRFSRKFDRSTSEVRLR